MMFNRRINKNLANLVHLVDDLTTHQRDKYLELRQDLDRLVAALGLVKHEKHITAYVKKGGPEQG